MFFALRFLYRLNKYSYKFFNKCGQCEQVDLVLWTELSELLSSDSTIRDKH